jgi:hypothetical protein
MECPAVLIVCTRTKTLDHLFYCPHPVLKSKQEILLEQLRKKGLSLGIPCAVMEGIVGLLHKYITDTPSLRPASPYIAPEWEAQH